MSCVSSNVYCQTESTLRTYSEEDEGNCKSDLRWEYGQLVERPAKSLFPRFVNSFNGADTLWDNPEFVRTYHKLSYWSSKTSNSSWDALILTDPPISQVSSTLAPNEVTKTFNFQPETQLCPSISATNTISTDPSMWGVHEASSLYISMFDDILALQDSKPHETTEDPSSSTNLCRRMVVASMIGFLRRRHLNLLRGIVQDTQHPTCTPYVFHHASWLREKDWNNPWRSGIVESLLNAKIGLNYYQREVTEEIAVLGMNPTAMHKPLAPKDDWERIAWKETQDWITLLLQMVDILMQTCNRQAAIHEAQQSNSIAKSVGKITTIAAVFFPISIVAGIFSMGGEFIPGGDLFWVFWTFAGPLCLVTGLYTLKTYYFQVVLAYSKRTCSEIGRRMRQNRTRELPR